MTTEGPRSSKIGDGPRPEPVTYPAQAPAVRAVLRTPTVTTRFKHRKK